MYNYVYIYYVYIEIMYIYNILMDDGVYTVYPKKQPFLWGKQW